MTSNPRFIAINGRELRIQRLALGWTQAQLAKSAGYTERLIRKAEKGGTLDIATIQNLAEALSTSDKEVPTESLTLDIAVIARKWFEAYETLERQMVKEVEPFLTDDFEFVCPGEPGTVPFIGTWKGVAGMQQWLDLYFGLFQRHKSTGVEYMVGDNTVVARWMESGTFQGIPCAPVRINMHFRFVDGLISRIEDDYDTHGGATNVAEAQALLLNGVAPA